MKRTTTLAIVSALFFAAVGRAQSPTPSPSSATQPAVASGIENDPAFKRLPPDEQAWVKQILERTHKAIENQDAEALDSIKQDIAKHQAAALASQKTGAPANAQNSQTGCTSGPVKKPGFHIPKALQNAIDKQAKQVSKQTGVDIDTNAPSQAVKDARKNIPCPPAIPAPGQPAANK
jgi:hypothetical protein